jgi:putative membrane protein
MMLVRVFINGLALIATAALLPDIYFVDPSLLKTLFLAAILGLLNAFVKPLLQFLTLAFIFATYGLVIVVINTIILLLLSSLLPRFFGVDSLFWGLVGGATMGILSGALESLFGLNLPITTIGNRRLAGSTRPAPQSHSSQPRFESPVVEEEDRGEPAAGEASDAEVSVTTTGVMEEERHGMGIPEQSLRRDMNLQGDEER